MPPNAGSGLEQFRLRVWRPVPHVTSQGVQSLQFVQSPFTAHKHTQTRDTWTKSLTRETVPINKQICAKLLYVYVYAITLRENKIISQDPVVLENKISKFCQCFCCCCYFIVKECGSSFKQTSIPFIQECFVPNVFKLIVVLDKTCFKISSMNFGISYIEFWPFI